MKAKMDESLSEMWLSNHQNVFSCHSKLEQCSSSLQVFPRLTSMW